MKKWLKWTLIIMGVISLSLYGLYRYGLYSTKKHSPEAVAAYSVDGTEISINYSQPGVKGRVVFGELVPYGEVWRTGANEATTFSTNRDLLIGEERLAAGDYTLWTVPGPRSWTIIWNEKSYFWGINAQGAAREEDYDVLAVEAEVQELDELVERFTIEVSEEQNQLSLRWEYTEVSIPFQKAP